MAHSHAQNYPLSPSEAAFRLCSFPVRRHADFFMACSRQAGIDRFGMRVCNDTNRFFVLNNGIDLARYRFDAQKRRDMRDELGLSEETPVFGHVGRFDPVKNHRFLLDVFAAVAEDDDRLVFISSDSSLLTFEAKNVRPQGRTAGGMAGIKLAEGARVAAFNVVPAGKVAWTYEEGENGLTSGSGAVVLTVAGDSDALPGTENGAAKVTPLEMYPTKGRATGGVRSHRFLKGQNTLILAWVGLYPLHASTSAGSPVELPKPDMRRDGSGVDLASPIAFIA